MHKADKYADVKTEIAAIYHENKGRYGYRRITMVLRSRGSILNHKTVQRLMKELGLVCRVRIKKYRSYKGEVGKIAPNLLNRDFRAQKPNQKWVTDVTEFSLYGQKLYLSPILDLHNGYLVSYTISEHPVLNMVTTMLEKAYEKAKGSNAQIVVFRSDQYREDLKEFVKVKWTLHEKQLPPYRPMNFRSFTGNVFRVFVGWAWDKLFERKFVEEKHLKFQELRTSNDMLFVFSAIAFAKRIEIEDVILAHQRRNNPKSLSNTREKSWECFRMALNALKDALTAHGNFWEFEQDYINYALHFSLWNLDTITGPNKERLYNKLKNEWFAEFGIDSLPAERFYDKKEYAKYLKIKSGDFNAYCEQ